MAHELFYSSAAYGLAHGNPMPSGTDVGFMFLQYYKQSVAEEHPRERMGMITNGDGTFDVVYGVYQDDGTYTDASLSEGVAGSTWPSTWKAINGQCYVVSMTRAEFNELGTAMGV